MIACTSTLTGTEWQPADRSADDRIITVLPRMKNHHNAPTARDRNVVYYFAKSTLHRVLNIAARDPDSRHFLERWRTDDGGPQFCQEFLADGDTAIQVDIVGSDKWR
jgi:hypothetical protein